MAEGVLNARGVRRRAEIVAAARSLFSEVGYRGATMAAIAVRAGVTHAGLLYHFETKEAVLEAVLDDERGRADELVRPDGAPGADGPVAADGEPADAHLDHLDRLRALVARNVADPEWTRLFSLLLGESVAVDHPVRSRMAERYDGLTERLAVALGDLAEPGARPGEAELAGLARLLLAVMDGLQYQSLTGSGVDVEREFALMTDLVRARLATGVENESPTF